MFNETNGSIPMGALTADAGGHLYGTTSQGGDAKNDGAVFELALAAQLAFVQQPTNTLAGSTISPAMTVDVEDANGHLVVTDNSDVTISISQGPSGATLSGTLTEQAVNGVATFRGVSLPLAGIYALNATDGVLTAATSDDFGVTDVGIAGTWQMSGELSRGTITTDNHGGILSGSITTNSGTRLVIANGSYAVDDQGNLSVTCADKSGDTFTCAGSVNAAKDVLTGISTSYYPSGDLGVMVINTGSFSDADLSGSWAFTEADGSGTLTFNGKGSITGGSFVWQDGYSGDILSGSTYSVTSKGVVTMKLVVPNEDKPGQNEQIDLSGALNASKDVIAADEAADPSDLTQPTLFVVTKHTGTFGLSDVSGTWGMASDGMTGDISFDGAGNITGGEYSNENGEFSISGGTYTVASTGLVTASFATDDPDNATVDMTGSLNSTKDVLAVDNADRGAALAADGFIVVLTNPYVTAIGSSAQLAFSQQPTNAATSATISPALTVDVEDADGHLVTSDDSDVTIGIASGPSGATLGGTLTEPAVNGVAAFSDLSLSTAGLYTLEATDFALTPAVSNGFAVTSPGQQDEFGTVGTKKGVKLQLTNSGGTIATFAMSGAGTGTIIINGDEWDLVVSGSTAASGLTITTVKSPTSGSAQVSLGQILVEGPLGTFSGPEASLTGAMSVNGSLGALTLYDLTNDGGIALGGAATGKTTLSFNQVEDESLTCGNTIASLKAACWEDSDGDGTDSISAPGLTTATIKNGDLVANLDIGTGGIGSLSVTGGSISGGIADAGVLTTLKVTGGNLSGKVSAASAGTVSVTGGNLGGSLNFSGALGTLGLITTKGNGGNVLQGASVNAGSIGRLSVGGSLQGVSGNGIAVSAGSIGSLNAGGEMDYTTITIANPARKATVPALGTLSVGGGMLNSPLTTDGKITSVTVKGTIDASVWYVAGSVGAITAGLGGSGWEANFTGNVTSLTIKGDFDSTFAAANLGNVTIAGTMNNAMLLAGANLEADTYASGSIGALNVHGDVDNSVVCAGLNPDGGGWSTGNTNAFFPSPTTSVLGSLTIGGAIDADPSYFDVGIAPLSVTIGGKKYNPRNLPGFVVGWAPVPSGDVTYIGQFNEKYSIITGFDASDNPITVTGRYGFSLTLSMHLLVTVAGMSTYTIDSVQSTCTYFGARFAVVPLAGSVAILPRPALNVSNQAGEGFSILFPNGTSLVTDNAAGAMHQSSNNEVISNAVVEQHSWTAGPDMEAVEFPVDDFQGAVENYNDVTSSTWAFTEST